MAQSKLQVHGKVGDVGGGFCTAGLVEIQEPQRRVGILDKYLLVVKIAVGPHRGIRGSSQQFLCDLPGGGPHRLPLGLGRGNVPGVREPHVHDALQVFQFDGGRADRQRVNGCAVRRRPVPGLLPDPAPGPLVPGVFEYGVADPQILPEVEQGAARESGEREAARRAENQGGSQEVLGAQERVHPGVPGRGFVGLVGPEDLQIAVAGADHGPLGRPVHHHFTPPCRVRQRGQAAVAACRQQVQLSCPELGCPDAGTVLGADFQDVVARGPGRPGP